VRVWYSSTRMAAAPAYAFASPQKKSLENERLKAGLGLGPRQQALSRRFRLSRVTTH
jgi:hypothetical protein